MTASHGIFTVKLYELERAFGHFQSRLQLCQRADHEKIRKEIETLQDECLEMDILLANASERSRTRLVAELAQAQVIFNKEAQSCLNHTLHSSDDLHEQAEAATVYAEFAIDHAIQAMNHALLSALNAMDRQLAADETTKEDPS